jgi:hypothetical protein
VEAVFNYPTLAESYKVAALDAMNQMHAISRVESPSSNGTGPRSKAARARAAARAAAR